MEKVRASSKREEVILTTKKSANLIFGDVDLITRPTRQQGMWVSQVDRIGNIAYSFYLFSDLTREEAENIELVDEKHLMLKAGGIYRMICKKRFPKTDIKKEAYVVSGAFHYFNPKYEGEFQNGVYVYDVNKAYCAHLAEGYYPDVDAGDLGCGIAKYDEVGYEVIGNNIVRVVETGEFAEVRFPKRLDSSLSSWAVAKGKEMEELKKSGKTKELLEEKLSINVALGILRNHNPWWYVYIVNTVCKKMKNLINEDTLLCNTDSIFSLTKREDLDIGTGLGQFKVECADGRLYYKGNNFALYDKDGQLVKHVHQGVKKEEQDDISFINGKSTEKTAKYKIIKHDKGVMIL